MQIPWKGCLEGEQMQCISTSFINSRYGLKVSCPAEVTAEMLHTLFGLVCFLFSCINLILFMDHNMEKTLQWQFKDLFLSPALPVMWDLRETTFFASSFLSRFLPVFLVLIYTLLRSGNCPCSDSQLSQVPRKLHLCNT